MSRRPFRLVVLLLSLAVLWPAGAADEPEHDRSTRRGEAYSRLMNAMFVARQGRVGDAVREIGEAVKLDPDSVDLKAESSALLLIMGQQQQAEKLVRQGLEAEPDHGRSLSILADILTGRIMGGRGSEQSLAEAIDVYERLIRQPDAEPEHFRLLTTFRLRSGDTEGAVRVARLYALRHAGDAEAVRLLANVLMHGDRDVEALDEVVRFLRDTQGLDVESSGFRDGVALLENLVRSRDAWKLFADRAEELVQARPAASGVRALYGEALLRIGQPVQAGEQMERAMEQAGSDPMLRYQLATVYTTLGRLADAAGLVTGLAEEFPGNHGVQTLQAEVLSDQGRYDEAIQAYDRAVEILEEDGTETERRDHLRRQVVQLHLALDRPQQARERLADLENPASVDALELAGRVALALNDYAEAGEMAQRLRRAGEDGEGVFLEAKIRAAKGEVGKAARLFQEAARSLGSTRVWDQAAFTLAEAGTPEAARKLLRGWRDREPANPNARFVLGRFLEQQEEFDAMEREMEEAIRLNPNFAVALNHLGYSLADRNRRLPQALEYIQRALKLDPWNAAYQDSLGWVYYRMGEYDKAREPLEQAAASRPADPVVLEHLGDLYDKLGLTDSAVASWRLALSAGPAAQEQLEAKIAAILDREGDRDGDTP